MTTHPEMFDSVKHAETVALNAAENEDWLLCQMALEHFFEKIGIEGARIWEFNDFHVAMEWFRAMHFTRFSDAPENSPARIFFLRLWGHIFENAPPEVKKIIDDSFQPGAAPTGYSDDGQPVYRVEDIAKDLGVTVEELHQKVEEMQKNGIDIMRHAVWPEDVNPIQ